MTSLQFCQTLQEMRPGAQWTLRGDTLEWLDTTSAPPTQDEIDAYLLAHAYREKRAAEYPSIGDQLDAMWKGGDAASAMLLQIQAVKAKYPKVQ